jgi:hypothetical protein
MSFALLTDRQRVELAIPPRLVFGLVVADCFGINPESDPDEAQAELDRNVARLKELLAVACAEPLDGLPAGKRSSVARRIERVTNTVAEEFDQQPAAKIGMALYYFLEDLLQRGVIHLWDGSAFAETMQILMPMFEHGFAIERMDASAQKQARRMREQLQREGYYRQ